MSVSDTQAGGPRWPLPWHVDGFDDEWFVLADNDWPVCQCETEEAANAVALLRSQKEKLVEALRPFVAFDTPDTWRNTSWEHDEVGAVLHSYNTGLEITREHFAAARAALRDAGQ